VDDTTPSTSPLKDADAVVTEVAEVGLLFLSDPKRGNAIEVLTGQFPRGSWWSHPQANAIYDILNAVEQHPDVMLAKLLSGKVTMVHRKLWPALLAVASSREPWQTEGLSAVGAQWLAAFDAAEAAGEAMPAASRTVIKEIEARLLAHGENVHTDSGKHETRLESWRSWAERVGQKLPAGGGAAVAEAKRVLEEAAARLGPPAVEFPWSA
jgi:hypothetical protein